MLIDVQVSLEFLHKPNNHQMLKECLVPWNIRCLGKGTFWIGVEDGHLFPSPNQSTVCSKLRDLVGTSCKIRMGQPMNEKLKKRRNYVILKDNLLLLEWKEKKCLSYEYHLTAWFFIIVQGEYLKLRVAIDSQRWEEWTTVMVIW